MNQSNMNQSEGVKNETQEKGTQTMSDDMSSEKWIYPSTVEEQEYFFQAYQKQEKKEFLEKLIEQFNEAVKDVKGPGEDDEEEEYETDCTACSDCLDYRDEMIRSIQMRNYLRKCYRENIPIARDDILGEFIDLD